MKKVLIYAGTTEGRELAEKLSNEGIPCVCCVATEYGSMVMRADEAHSPLIEVRQGRLTAPEMAGLEESGEFLAVVDATHPFAEDVTDNIRKSKEMVSGHGLQLPFLRLLRDAGDPLPDGSFLYETAKECADALAHTEGKILLTTGSKELGTFCRDEGLRGRIVARVLPGRESVAACYEAGLSGSQIIAMQGPFSEEMNRAIFHQYHIEQLVTKESGRAGGTDEKIRAAGHEGIPCHVIRRPGEREEGKSLSEILDCIRRLAGRPEKGPEIYLIGTGPGDPALITQEAKDVISRADYLFGARRMIEPFSPRREKKAMYLPSQILPEIRGIGRGTVAILFSGDSGFYSGCSAMLAALKAEGFGDVHVLPGISSIQVLSARTGISWEDAGIVSLHGKSPDAWQVDVIRAFLRYEKVFFLTSGVKDVRVLCTFLQEQGEGDANVTLGYQLSYPEEKVFGGRACELADFHGEKGLYCGFIVRAADKKRVLTHSIPDSFFIRGKVPMTKQEVRALSIEKLRLMENSVLYDIGSGTGSVAVEAACLSPSVKVFAAEMLEEALDLIRMNREKAHAFNLTVVPGKAPDALSGLPAPDAAFIGGTSGKLEGILAVLYEKNPEMRVVMTAVTLESISKMTACLRRFPVKNEEVLQVSVSRAASLGHYHLMRAENPVYIFSFDFGGERY